VLRREIRPGSRDVDSGRQSTDGPRFAVLLMRPPEEAARDDGD
jgi:hypothetical protein